MSDYGYLDDEALDRLLAQRRRNLRILEEQAAAYGSGRAPLALSNQLDGERGEIAAILAEQQRRRDRPSSRHVARPQPPRSAEVSRVGSPFVVGRPLRPDEPIFGRDAALRFVAGELAKFSSVNIVAERRMGKTSLLNHLLGHQEIYLPRQPGRPQLVPARLDLQADVSDAARFYGLALRELLVRTPLDASSAVRELADLRERLDQAPASDYDEFERLLRRLRDDAAIHERPIVVVDEFERLLAAREGFPYPGFFDRLRALITADLLAMVVASRRPLAEYFADPARPDSMTSTFPSYFIPLTLAPLDPPDADALLLQPSDHPLTLSDAAEARRWAGGHPCHLQVAGAAYYQAKDEGQPLEWVRTRREELKDQSCMVAGAARSRASSRRERLRRLSRALEVVFVAAPIQIGRLVQRLGSGLSDAVAWVIGVILIILVVLLILGVARGSDILDMLRKAFGF